MDLSSGITGAGASIVFVYALILLLWLIVPIFIILINSRVKEMREIARLSHAKMNEINICLQAIKERLDEEKQ